MRTTAYRRRTEREQGRIALIGDALWKQSSAATPRLGEAQMARAAGLSWSINNRDASRRAIRDLMPDVSRYIAITHPGYMVRRPGDRTAFVTSDPAEGVKSALPRILRVFTSLRRAKDDLEPAIGSGDPTMIMLYANVSAAQTVLENQVATSAGDLAERINAGEL